jgi:hypothetical protein
VFGVDAIDKEILVKDSIISIKPTFNPYLCVMKGVVYLQIDKENMQNKHIDLDLSQFPMIDKTSFCDVHSSYLLIDNELEEIAWEKYAMKGKKLNLCNYELIEKEKKDCARNENIKNLLIEKDANCMFVFELIYQNVKNNEKKYLSNKLPLFVNMRSKQNEGENYKVLFVKSKENHDKVDLIIYQELKSDIKIPNINLVMNDKIINLEYQDKQNIQFGTYDIKNDDLILYLDEKTTLINK